MSAVNWSTFLKWYLVGATVLILIGGLIYGIVRWEEAQSADRKASNAATARAVANACDPLKNVEVDYHGSGWSESARYEVTCADGSQRIVYPK